MKHTSSPLIDAMAKSINTLMERLRVNELISLGEEAKYDRAAYQAADEVLADAKRFMPMMVADLQVAAKLPRTADRIPVHPGMTIFDFYGVPFQVDAITARGHALHRCAGDDHFEYSDIAHIESMYSTREAAMAARVGGPG